MKLKKTTLNNIDTLIFDFGNVLLDIDIERSITEFKKLQLNKINPLDIHPNNAGIFLKIELGQASVQDFTNQLRQTAKNPENISDKQILDAWNAMLLPFDYKRFELIEKLRTHYSIILLSNTNKAHHDYFETKFNNENPYNKPFRSYFDSIFYSDELKMRKPNRDIYLAIEKATGINPSHTLFIDDNAPNLIEPNKIGWQTYHLVKPQTIFDLFQ